MIFWCHALTSLLAIPTSKPDLLQPLQPFYPALISTIKKGTVSFMVYFHGFAKQKYNFDHFMIYFCAMHSLHFLPCLLQYRTSSCSTNPFPALISMTRKGTVSFRVYFHPPIQKKYHFVKQRLQLCTIHDLPLVPSTTLSTTIYRC